MTPDRGRSRREEEQERIREVLAALGGTLDQPDRVHEEPKESTTLSTRVEAHIRLQSQQHPAASSAAEPEPEQARTPTAVVEPRRAPAPLPKQEQEPTKPPSTPRLRPALDGARVSAAVHGRGAAAALVRVATTFARLLTRAAASVAARLPALAAVFVKAMWRAAQLLASAASLLAGVASRAGQTMHRGAGSAVRVTIRVLRPLPCVATTFARLLTRAAASVAARLPALAAVFVKAMWRAAQLLASAASLLAGVASRAGQTMHRGAGSAVRVTIRVLRPLPCVATTFARLLTRAAASVAARLPALAAVFVKAMWRAAQLLASAASLLAGVASRAGQTMHRGAGSAVRVTIRVLRPLPCVATTFARLLTRAAASVAARLPALAAVFVKAMWRAAQLLASAASLLAGVASRAGETMHRGAGSAVRVTIRVLRPLPCVATTFARLLTRAAASVAARLPALAAVFVKAMWRAAQLLASAASLLAGVASRAGQTMHRGAGSAVRVTIRVLRPLPCVATTFARLLTRAAASVAARLPALAAVFVKAMWRAAQLLASAASLLAGVASRAGQTMHRGAGSAVRVTIRVLRPLPHAARAAARFALAQPQRASASRRSLRLPKRTAQQEEEEEDTTADVMAWLQAFGYGAHPPDTAPDRLFEAAATPEVPSTSEGGLRFLLRRPLAPAAFPHSQPAAIASCGALLGSLTALAVGVATGHPITVVVPLAVVGTLGAIRVSKMSIQWTSVVTVMLAVIFFIPIKRYTLPGAAAFDLEPYRVVVALILVGWFLLLLADRAVLWRRTLLDGPLLLLVSGVLASDLTNAHRVASLGSYAVKALTFFLSFALVYYMLTSTIQSKRDLDRIISVLVGFGTVVALTALFEFKTHVNVFNHLSSVFPILRLRSDGLISSSDLARNGNLRAYASAQHPIALGALLVLLIPLAAYLAHKRSRRWWIAAFVLLLGTLTSGSRTAVLMLVAIVIVYFCLRRRSVLQFWPLLLPGLVAVHFALPGTIGGIRGAFFPKGGLVKQQDNIVRGNQLRSNGRLADIRPALHEIAANPLTGLGYGTRITAGPDANAAVLDDTWLGTLEETGFIGVFAWLWIFVRSVRRLGRAARKDESDRGWLLVALAASIVGFAVAMFTYDAFSFIQVTFLIFILLAMADRVLTLAPGPDPAPGSAAQTVG